MMCKQPVQPAWTVPVQQGQWKVYQQVLFAVVCDELQGALHAAHQNTKVPGSATACVIQLDQERRTLEAANLVSEEQTAPSLGQQGLDGVVHGSGNAAYTEPDHHGPLLCPLMSVPPLLPLACRVTPVLLSFAMARLLRSQSPCNITLTARYR
jgi:hypothetical protein